MGDFSQEQNALTVGMASFESAHPELPKPDSKDFGWLKASGIVNNPLWDALAELRNADAKAQSIKTESSNQSMSPADAFAEMLNKIHEGEQQTEQSSPLLPFQEQIESLNNMVSLRRHQDHMLANISHYQQMAESINLWRKGQPEGQKGINVPTSLVYEKQGELEVRADVAQDLHLVALMKVMCAELDDYELHYQLTLPGGEKSYKIFPPFAVEDVLGTLTATQKLTVQQAAEIKQISQESADLGPYRRNEQVILGYTQMLKQVVETMKPDVETLKTQAEQKAQPVETYLKSLDAAAVMAYAVTEIQLLDEPLQEKFITQTDNSTLTQSFKLAGLHLDVGRVMTNLVYRFGEAIKNKEMNTEQVLEVANRIRSVDKLLSRIGTGIFIKATEKSPGIETYIDMYLKQPAGLLRDWQFPSNWFD